MTLHLRESDVDKLLSMDDALRLIEQVFSYSGAQRVVNQPRRRVGSGQGTLNVMFAAIPALDVAGLKSYPVSRGGVNFMVLLYRASTSELLAIVEAGRLGQLRTGAATGVATKHLARADSSTLGLLGAGKQAETQLEAVASIRELTDVRVYSRNRERLESFCSRMAERLALSVSPADSPEECLESDVLITATTSTSPVFDGSLVRPGTHVNAIGSNFASKAEIDINTISTTSLVVVDSIESARIEGGDLIPAVERGLLAWEHVVELGDLLQGRVRYDRQDEDITLFKSHGVACEDVMLAHEAYQRALVRGVGQTL